MPGTSTLRWPEKQVAVSLAATASVVADPMGDLRLVFRRITWEDYVAINDTVVGRATWKMIYCDGRLTLLTESRKHGWCSRCLYVLVIELAAGLRMKWETGGSATYRRPDKEKGVEGDETFYFGDHAEIMKGPKDIDLDVQPPPDLAVEVEVSHSADDAVIVWGRLGVPEVWRFDPIEWTCTFWSRRRNGTYAPIERSRAFSMLTPADVVEQIRLAEDLGSMEWQQRVRRWVRQVIVPRKRKGV